MRGVSTGAFGGVSCLRAANGTRALAWLAAAVLALATTGRASAQTIIYVNAAAAPGGNGQSWATAYRDLQSAISEARAVPQAGRNVHIWVAQGTYFPSERYNPPDPRSVTFEAPVGVSLYGGFSGSETSIDQRNITVFRTILSGDLDQNDGPSFTGMEENAYFLFRILNLHAAGQCRIDGFTLTGANNIGGGGYSGAVFIAGGVVNLSNLTIWRNDLAAGALYSSETYPEWSWNQQVTVNVDRVMVVGNRSGSGVGFYSNRGTWTVYNSAVIHNQVLNSSLYTSIAVFSRGTMYLRGCTIAANVAPNTNNGAGGIFTPEAAFIILNFSDTVIWNNVNSSGDGPAAQASAGGLDNCRQGSVSFGVDPLFVNLLGVDGVAGTLDDSVAISALSPLVDAGQVGNYIYNGSNPDWLLDVNGLLRIVDGDGDGAALPDIGASEFGSFPTTFAGRLYVQQGFVGGTGASWGSPLGELRHALAVAAVNNVAEIWVAAGTYTPSPPLSQGGSRSASFQLRNSLAIYGGFAGNETEHSQRDIAANPTILSGDLNGDDVGSINQGDNSFHIAEARNGETGVVIDGFTFRGGNAEGHPSEPDGAALYGVNAGIIVRNCRFEFNSAPRFGGAVYLSGAQAPTAFTACRFVSNSSVGNATWTAPEGGAVSLSGGGYMVPIRDCVFEQNRSRYASAVKAQSAAFFGCDFIGNNTTQPHGVGTFTVWVQGQGHVANSRFIGNVTGLPPAAYYGNGPLVNSIFIGNRATDTTEDLSQGYLTGAAYTDGPISNCVVIGNRVDSPTAPCAGISVQSDGTIVANTILWGNTVGSGSGETAQFHRLSGPPGNSQIRYSTVQGWTGAYGGPGNNGLDPRFRRMPSPGPDNIWGTSDDDYGDLRLTNGSPAIDSGDSAAVPLDTFDIDGDGNTTESLPWDLDGGSRFVDDPLVANTGIGSPPVDRGCYEFVPPVVTQPGDRRWVSPDGGNFASLFNWFPAVPGALDNAVFDIPGSYTVNMPSPTPAQVRSLNVDRGGVTLNLAAGTHNVTATDGRALVVGRDGPYSPILSLVGGRLNAASAIVGDLPGSSGLCIVGSGATLAVLPANLIVGYEGEGALAVNTGGRLITRNAFLGFLPGSQTYVSVAGVGARWDNQLTIFVDNGTLYVGPGAVVSSGFPIYVLPEGEVAGEGTINAGVVNLGSIQPGSSPGTLTINGAYEQVGNDPIFGPESGAVRAQIAGPNPGQFDRLVVNGTATLGGGLFVEFVDGYAPQPDGQGQFPSFRLLESTQPLASRFDVAFFPPVPAVPGEGAKFLRAVYPNRGPGAVDLVIADLGTNPDFNNPDSFNVDGGPTAAAVGDLNRDGLPDLAITLPDTSDPDNENGVVVVLFNLGVDNDNQWLGFGGATQVNVQKFPSGVAIGDFDGIFGNDLAVTNMRSDTLSIVGQQSAAGEFASVLTVPTGREPTAVIAFNLDRAGRVDLGVAEGADNTVGMYANSNAPGTAGFVRTTTAPVGVRPAALRPFNPDNDKDVDVAVANSGSSSLSVLPNLGFGDFGPAVTIAVGDEPVGLIATSLLDRGEEDLRQDLVVVNRGGNSGRGSVSVIVNTTPPNVTNTLSFAPAVENVLFTTNPGGASPSSLAAVDMDDDGDRDVAVLARNSDDSATVVRVLRNDLNGGEQLAFAESAQLPAGLGPVAVLSADVDGDGRQDLITVNTGPRGPGTGSVEILRNALAPPPTLCAADFDNNGQVQVADIFAFLGAWFQGVPAAVHFGGVPGVPAIFAFLTAWFAGC